jgi:DNA-binding Lrp family transcriptional regulator
VHIEEVWGVLDRIDKRIVQVLARNARITNKELAEEVGLSASACLERVRRLTERGVLKGFHADIDPQALDIGVQALVQVRLRRHTRRAVASFEKKVLEFPQVVALHHVTGRTDYVAHVVARDIDQLRDFTLDAINVLSEVGTVETSIVLASKIKPGWPDLSGV